MRFGLNFGLLGSKGSANTFCMTIGNNGTLYGYLQGSFGTIDPIESPDGIEITQLTWDATGNFILQMAGDAKYNGLDTFYFYSDLQPEPVVMTWGTTNYTGTDSVLANLLIAESEACLSIRTTSKLSASLEETISGTCSYDGGGLCEAVSTYVMTPINSVGTVSYTWTVTNATLVSGQGTDTITVSTTSDEDTIYDVSCEISDDLNKVVTREGSYVQYRVASPSLTLGAINELTYLVCEPVEDSPCTMTSTYDVTASLAHGTVGYRWTIVGDAVISEQSGNTCTVTTFSDNTDEIPFTLTCTATDNVSSAVSTDTFTHVRVSDNFCILQGESTDGLWRGASDSGPFGSIDPTETQFGLHVYALKWLDGNIGDGIFRMRFGVAGDTQIPDTDLIRVTIDNQSVVMTWDSVNLYYEGTNTPMATVLWNNYVENEEICGLAEFLPDKFISYDFEVQRGTAVVTPIGG